MKIRSFFLLCMAGVAVISLALAAIIAQVAWQRLDEKTAGLAAIENFALILKASEALTLERAPSNGLLNAEQGDAAATRRIADARAGLDAVLKELAKGTSRQGRDNIAALERAIAASRQVIDREAAKPRSQREAAALAASSRQQLALSDLLTPIVLDGLQTVSRIDPDLSTLAELASTAADGRETGGRRASTVAAPLLAGRAFTTQEAIAADQLEGRMVQLYRDIEQQIGRVEPDAGINRAWATAKSTYFDKGAALVAQILDAGRTGANYPMPYVQYSSQVVPSLQSILGVRDEALRAAVAGANDKRQKALNTLLIAIGAMVLVIVVVGGVAIGFTRRVVAPLAAMTGVVGRLAGGERDVSVPYQQRSDEIGAMAQAVEVFRQNAIAAERVQQEAAEGRLREAELKREQEDRERAAADERRANEEKARLAEVERQREAAEATRRAEAERQAEAERLRQEAENRRKAELHDLASSFQSAVGGVVDAVASAATEMQATATSMTGIADRTARQSLAASSATEQAAANVQTVASASEELSASIREIASQVANSSRIASSAVEQAQRTDAIVQGLASSAEKIGEVVGLINQIAGQTNLLALNATIEAARAGEAGKGFAVVASEVKNLATQTSKATDEIGQQIGSVQTATQSAVAAIREIGGVIGQINEIASAIAAAVEQQGAATNEIARNVEQAANGTKEASANVTEVNQSAREAGSAAGQVLDASGELSRQAERLRAEVGGFLDRIRAG
jgi:methyl-accepting chemotaxis protein